MKPEKECKGGVRSLNQALLAPKLGVTSLRSPIILQWAGFVSNPSIRHTFNRPYYPPIL